QCHCIWYRPGATATDDAYRLVAEPVVYRPDYRLRHPVLVSLPAGRQLTGGRGTAKDSGQCAVNPALMAFQAFLHQWHIIHVFVADMLNQPGQQRCTPAPGNAERVAAALQ